MRVLIKNLKKKKKKKKKKLNRELDLKLDMYMLTPRRQHSQNLTKSQNFTF